MLVITRGYIPLNPMKNPIKPPFSYGFPLLMSLKNVISVTYQWLISSWMIWVIVGGENRHQLHLPMWDKKRHALIFPSKQGLVNVPFLMGFYSDLMGFYSDLMGPHPSSIWVCLKMLAKPRKTQWFCWSDIPFWKMAISLGRLTQHFQVQTHLTERPPRSYRVAGSWHFPQDPPPPAAIQGPQGAQGPLVPRKCAVESQP